MSGEGAWMVLPEELAGVERVRESRAEIFSALRAMRDPQARFQWLVDRARSRAALPDVLRRDEYRVTGCQVRLWWVSVERDGRRWFGSDRKSVV